MICRFLNNYFCLGSVSCPSVSSFIGIISAHYDVWSLTDR